MRRRWLTSLASCALIAPLMASAQPVSIFPGDDDAEKKEFIEREVKLPPFPKDGSLLQFDPSAANSNRFFVDADSISIDDDGTVRSYEAIRCETTEQKAYAFGRRDGTWSNARAPVWRKIRYQDVNRQYGVLYASYFCPDGAPIASVKDAINRFKYGVPYGQPPRSSNRR